MVAIIAGGVAALVGSYLLYRYATRPIAWKVPLPELRTYLDTLLKRGYDGSYVVIEEPCSRRFVQLAKYIKVKGEIGLELSFAKTTWSAPFYDKLEALLHENAIPFTRRPVDTPPTIEFLEIDFGRDTAEGYRIVNLILMSIFKMPSSTLFKVRLSNLSVHDELVDGNYGNRRAGGAAAGTTII